MLLGILGDPSGNYTIHFKTIKPTLSFWRWKPKPNWPDLWTNYVLICHFYSTQNSNTSLEDFITLSVLHNYLTAMYKSVMYTQFVLSLNMLNTDMYTALLMCIDCLIHISTIHILSPLVHHRHILCDNVLHLCL